MSVQTKKTCCPTCFYLFDWCSALGHENEAIEPMDGEPSVCLNCGRLLIFRNRQAVAATAAEVRELMTDFPRVWEKIEQVREAIIHRGRFLQSLRDFM